MKLLTTKQLMEQLQISRTTLHRYKKAGMPCLQLGSQNFRYRLDEVTQWIDKHMEEKQQVINGYITADQMQQELMVSRSTLWRLTKSGMPCRKDGKRLLYKKEDVMKWIRENGNSTMWDK